MSTGTRRWNTTTGTVMMNIIGIMTTKRYWPKLIAIRTVTKGCVIAIHTTQIFTTGMNTRVCNSEIPALSYGTRVANTSETSSCRTADAGQESGHFVYDDEWACYVR
jgi:hypothetical protein